MKRNVIFLILVSFILGSISFTYARPYTSTINRHESFNDREVYEKIEGKETRVLGKTISESKIRVDITGNGKEENIITPMWEDDGGGSGYITYHSTSEIVSLQANQYALRCRSMVRTNTGSPVDIAYVYVHGRLFKIVDGFYYNVIDETNERYNNSDAKVEKVAGIITEPKEARGVHKYQRTGFNMIEERTYAYR